MLPLVPGEETKDLALLEHTICHKIDADLLAMLPRLSEADCASRKKWLVYQSELHATNTNKTDKEILQELFAKSIELPPIFVRHGIFALGDCLSATALMALLLLFSEEENALANSRWLRTTMGGSAAKISYTVKELKKCGLVIYCPWPEAKGRAKGRQQGYAVFPSVRKILNGDLQNHAFFLSNLRDVVGPVVEKCPHYLWRKYLFETSN